MARKSADQTSDPNPLDTFTWQLVAGTGATHNASFMIAGDEVFTSAVMSRAVTASGVAALPVVMRDATGLVFTYRDANGVEPLLYEILQSTDLATWTLYQPAPANVSRVNNGAYNQVSVRVPPPIASASRPASRFRPRSR